MPAFANSLPMLIREIPGTNITRTGVLAART